METSIFRRVPSEPSAWKAVRPYGLAVCNSLVALGLTVVFEPLVQRTPLMMLYLAVVATAWFAGSGPGLLSVLLTVIFAEAFIIPVNDLRSSIWIDAVSLTFFTVTGLATVALLDQLRGRTRILREKDRQLTDFMENATVGLHWLAEDGAIVWANGAQASLLGCTLAGYVGRKFQDFHVDSREADEFLQRLGARERIKNFETRLRAMDGSIKTVLIDADVLWQGQTFVHARCFVRDLTARKSMEEALRQSELRFRQLAENINVVFWLWSPQERQFLYVSPVYEKVSGRSCASLMADPKTFLGAIHEDDRAAVKAKISTQESGTATLLEYRILRPDGNVRWVRDQAFPLTDDAGKVHRIAGLTEDITGQKEIALRVLESETKFRAVFENSLDAIGVSNEGKLVMVNPALLRLFGYRDAGELTGHPVIDLVAPSQKAVVLKYASRRESGNSAPSTYETRGIRRDGTEFDFEVDASTFSLNAQRHTLFILRDVTERKKAEEAVQRINEALEARVQERTRQLEEANRELEAFSCSISHDLRAPVRAINGFSRIIEEDHAQGLDRETLRLFRVIHMNAQRMSQLIDDLLAFSRLNAYVPQLTPVDLTALARSLAEEHTDGAGTKTALQIHDMPAAAGDASLLRQVLANLIDNALKFSRQSPNPVVEIGGRREEREAVYFVKDNGVGFDMKYAGRLFKVFQRLHKPEQFEGTGVGLAIVQRIVSRHGGRVWVESQPGCGATFFFTLPIDSSRQP